ncbi:putative holin-like toxin [Staphylococcus aureus]|uniref:Holin-like toxin n=1 Tax=Staphylococcus aureus TaxID=1280 RepID=A0AB37XP40_STAAU|nr:putative holin-like toxin [Staphylococcus aureus]
MSIANALHLMLSFGMFIVTFIGIVVAIINLNNKKQPSFQNFDKE